MSSFGSSGDGSLENPFAEKSHQLPDGSWVSLQIESDPLYSKWTCFWMTFVAGQIRPAWYRVFKAGAPPSEWQPMKPAAAVDKQTDVEEDEEDPEETERENKGKLGAAKKLPAGRYVLQSKIRVGDEDVELTAIEFSVSRGPLSAGWG